MMMRKKVVFTAKFVTYVDVPIGSTRNEIVEAAGDIEIPEGKSQYIAGLESVAPVLYKENSFEVIRISSMQPTEDLFGNIN